MSTAVLASAEDDDDPLYEIINGEKVNMRLSSFYSMYLACQVAFKLDTFVALHDLGFVVAHALFQLPRVTYHCRRPKAAFVSRERWPNDKRIPEDAEAWDIVPDLAVEVVSRTELIEDLFDKISEYFLAGVRLVWIIFPKQRLVYVYESPTQIRVLTETGELDGGTVLPGFRLAVPALFPNPPTAT